MNHVRMGLIGLGSMGRGHARRIAEQMNRARLTAVCDVDKNRADEIAGKHECRPFYDASALLRSGEVDAVLIATPHYYHTPIAIEAFEAGLHVLVEKPIAVHTNDARKMIEAHTDKRLKFAAMFNQRTNPCYKKIKEIVASGELGKIMRTNWITTHWFRSQAYYDSGGWRATWAGEGGGVLLNQCPHQLDLFQWIAGMPSRVRAWCGIGRYHRIEVEDDVTAFLQYPGGATGIFIAATGESPGTNRLEIMGEMGRLVTEEKSVEFTRNDVSVIEFCAASTERFAKPKKEVVNFEFDDKGGAHNEVLQNFIDAILDDTPLIAEAEEGIRSVELGNAMLLSSLLGGEVEVPLDGDLFESRLNELIAGSKLKKKKVSAPAATDEEMEKSF